MQSSCSVLCLISKIIIKSLLSSSSFFVMAHLPWKAEIMRRISKRNEEEMSNFKDIIMSHCKLLEQVELMKRNIRNLEYKKDELDQELLNYQKEGVVTGGGGNSKLNKKVEELSAKLVERSLQLSEAHQGKADAMQQVADLSNRLHKKDDEISKKDSQIASLNGSVTSLEKKVADNEDALKSALLTNKKLLDEQNELQIEFNSQERRLQDALKNYDRMKQEVMKMKKSEADRINIITEKEKAEREESIKKQIEDAAKPKGSLVSSMFERRPSGSSKKKASISSEESLSSGAYNAVLPERVFYQTEAHDGEVSALCFGNKSNLLATGGADKTVKVWSMKDPQESIEQSFSLTGSGASIMSVQFDHMDKLLLAASNDFSARIWTVEDQRLRHSLTGHTAKVFTAKFMDNSQKVITGSQDKTLKIWDLKIKKCMKTLFAGSSCCDLVPAPILGNMVISGHWDRKIRFWDIRTTTGNELAIQGRVTSLSLYPDRYMLLCSTRDDTSLRLIDLRQNSITSTFTGFNLSTDWSRACFSPDGQYVAVGASDGTIHTWETLTGRPTKTKKDSSIHKGDVIGCAWHAKGQVFASVDRNKKLVMWKR